MSGLYIPSLVATLRIRFDERLLGQPTQFGTETDARVNATVGSPPGPVASANPIPGTTTPAIGQAPRTKLSLTSQSPAILSNGADNLTVLHLKVPLECSAQMPTYRQAGTFKLTFAWRDLPIDPQLVRACGVDIHVDAVSAPDFAAGMRGVRPDGTRASILTPTDANLRLTGLVDDWDTEHSGSNDQCTISGRDVRAIFIDSPARPAMLASLDPTLPIDQFVAQIVNKHPFGYLFTVDAGPAQQWPNNTIPAPGPLDSLPRMRRGANGRQARHGMPGDPNQMSFWDLIVNACQYVGAIPWISTSIDSQQKTIIRLSPARDLFDRMNQQGTNPYDPPPFAGNRPRTTTTSAQPLTFRKLVFGRDIGAIKLSRKHSGHVPKIVEVVSWNPSSGNKGKGKLLKARFPPIPDPADAPALATGANLALATGNANQTDQVSPLTVSRPSPSGKQSMNDVIRISKPGITDISVLRQIALAAFMEIAHGEIAGVCETNDLASLGGNNADPDMLSLKVGDPISFDADARRYNAVAPAVSQLTQAASSTTEQLRQQIQQQIGNSQLAQLIVQAIGPTGILQTQPIFRVSCVKFEWHGGRLGIAFDFQEYLTLGQKQIPLNQVPTTAPVPVSTAVGPGSNAPGNTAGVNSTPSNYAPATSNNGAGS